MDRASRSLPGNDALGDGVTWDRPDRDIPVIDSPTLMRDRRELIIRHYGQTYRLRVTASDKLILTK